MNTDSREGQLEALCDVGADYCSSLIEKSPTTIRGLFSAMQPDWFSFYCHIGPQIPTLSSEDFMNFTNKIIEFAFEFEVIIHY